MLKELDSCWIEVLAPGFFHQHRRLDEWDQWMGASSLHFASLSLKNVKDPLVS